MINFTRADDNKSFISIKVADSNQTQNICSYLISAHPQLKEMIKSDNDEILISVLSADELKAKCVSYDFSLNELRQELNSISKCKADYFTVDLDSPNFRYY